MAQGQERQWVRCDTCGSIVGEWKTPVVLVLFSRHWGEKHQTIIVVPPPLTECQTERILTTS